MFHSDINLHIESIKNPFKIIVNSRTTLGVRGADPSHSWKSVCNFTIVPLYLQFPCSLDGKESACNAGDLGSIPGSGRSPGEGNDYTLHYSDLEDCMDCIQSMGSQRVELDQVTFTFSYVIKLRWCHIVLGCALNGNFGLKVTQWQPTPVILLGKFHGQRGLLGYSPWCHKESDMTD